MSKFETFAVDTHIFSISLFRGRAYHATMFVRLLTEYVPAEVARTLVPAGCEIGKIIDITAHAGADRLRFEHDALGDPAPCPISTGGARLHAAGLTLIAIAQA